MLVYDKVQKYTVHVKNKLHIRHTFVHDKWVYMQSGLGTYRQKSHIHIRTSCAHRHTLLYFYTSTLLHLENMRLFLTKWNSWSTLLYTSSSWDLPSNSRGWTWKCFLRTIVVSLQRISVTGEYQNTHRNHIRHIPLKWISYIVSETGP